MEKKNFYTVFFFFLIICNYVFSGNIKKIVSGKSHTLILTNDGYVFAFGWNKAGQIGNGNDLNIFQPVEVKLNKNEYLKDIIDIGGGDVHSIVLKMDGTVLTWGGNYSGQLGNLKFENSNYPDFVRYKNGEIVKDIIKVSAGWDFSVILRKDGTVWTFGENKYGQLGDGTMDNKNYAVQVKGPDGKGYLRNIVDIKAGAFHVLALAKDGTIWAWGDNEFGQLGDGTYIQRPFPVKTKGINNIEKIACGAFHSLAIDRNGNLYGWGKNWKGQIGDGSFINKNIPVRVWGENGDGFFSDAKEVSAGRNHTVILNKKGEVFVVGSNIFGQLGNKILKKINFPIPVFSEEGNLKNVEKISASGNYSVALLMDGTLYLWGTNEGFLENKVKDVKNYTPTVVAKFNK
jgi:alpha-tubulin suppressor-like RCC1 family protein